MIWLRQLEEPGLDWRGREKIRMCWGLAFVKGHTG